MPADTASKTDTQHKEASALDPVALEKACEAYREARVEQIRGLGRDWVEDMVRAACTAYVASAPTLSSALEEARAENARLRAFKDAVYALAGPKPRDRVMTQDGDKGAWTEEQPWNVDLFEVERRAALKTESDNA